jgi:hypothetical protein
MINFDPWRTIGEVEAAGVGANPAMSPLFGQMGDDTADSLGHYEEICSDGCQHRYSAVVTAQ